MNKKARYEAEGTRGEEERRKDRYVYVESVEEIEGKEMRKGLVEHAWRGERECSGANSRRPYR